MGMAGFRSNGEYTRPLGNGRPPPRINAREIGLCRDLQHRLSTNSCISLPSSKLRLFCSESEIPIGTLVLSTPPPSFSLPRGPRILHGGKLLTRANNAARRKSVRPLPASIIIIPRTFNATCVKSHALLNI